MDLRRMLRALDDAGRSLVDADAPRLDDKADGYELAVSARDFSKSTRKVVDEKLTFSAALLRAGEVDEATRILAEVEHDVRNEEAALLERMNEVTAKRAVTRSRMTRMRLVRMLATAMVGAGLLGVSAMGMAVAGMFDGQKGRQHKDKRNVRMAHGGHAAVKKVTIGGVTVKLTKGDLETFRRLTSGSVDADVLERFLAADLDLPPRVVDQTIATVLSLNVPVVEQVTDAVEPVATAATEEAAAVVDAVKKSVKKPKQETATVEDTEPTPEETEEETAPATEETADPDGGDEDDEEQNNDEGEDGQKTGVQQLDEL